MEALEEEDLHYNSIQKNCTDCSTEFLNRNDGINIDSKQEIVSGIELAAPNKAYESAKKVKNAKILKKGWLIDGKINFMDLYFGKSFFEQYKRKKMEKILEEDDENKKK